MFPAAVSDSPTRRWSYAVVLAMAGLGLAFPAQAGILLGPPLAVGMVVLGVAHGACDQLVLPAARPVGTASGWRYWAGFLLGYLGLAGLVLVLWWRWPAATVGGFFAFTVWHWGSADAPAGSQVPALIWLLHSLARGLLLFTVPLWWWPAATAAIINGLLTFVTAAAIAPTMLSKAATNLLLLVAAGHLMLWLYYAGQRHWQLLKTELLEVGVLVGLLMALPPVLSVSVYFIYWHSLQHVLRLTGWLGYANRENRAALLPQLSFFLRRAAPLLLLSCSALLGLGYFLASHLPDGAAWFSLALVVASVVTLPHALLVTLVMDAARWQGLRLSGRANASPSSFK